MSNDHGRVEDTRAWLGKARMDLEAGRFESTNPILFPDVLFHAQQATEKALKAFLAWHDVPFRKTHDLGALGVEVGRIDQSLGKIVDRAVPLTEYAWKFRYPGDYQEPGVFRDLCVIRGIRPPSKNLSCGDAETRRKPNRKSEWGGNLRGLRAPA